MTKFVGMLLAVAIITAVMLIFIVTLIASVPFHLHSAVESKRVEINTTERPRSNLGLPSDIAPFDARPRWLSDRVIRITPMLGVNFDLIRLNLSAANFARSFKIRTSTTLSDEEFGSATKHRYSYETGIQVYLSPMQYVAINYANRYEEDSVATRIETELRF